jgi:hypothetical protein
VQDLLDFEEAHKRARDGTEPDKLLKALRQRLTWVSSNNHKR